MTRYIVVFSVAFAAGAITMDMVWAHRLVAWAYTMQPAPVAVPRQAI